MRKPGIRRTSALKYGGTTKRKSASEPLTEQLRGTNVIPLIPKQVHGLSGIMSQLSDKGGRNLMREFLLESLKDDSLKTIIMQKPLTGAAMCIISEAYFIWLKDKAKKESTAKESTKL